MRFCISLLAALFVLDGDVFAETRVQPGGVTRKGNKRIFRPYGTTRPATGAARPTTQVQREVDALIMQLGSRNEPVRKRTKERFKTLNEKAVPRLSDHIGAADSNKKMLALAALQYCWSEQAERLVSNAYLFEKDTVARVAFGVLMKRVQTGEVSQERLDELREKKK